jgi:hypothetical protein
VLLFLNFYHLLIVFSGLQETSSVGSTPKVLVDTGVIRLHSRGSEFMGLSLKGVVLYGLFVVSKVEPKYLYP